MKFEPLFLSLDEVIWLHQQMIRAHGGSQEIRDQALLESAVMMPAASFGGEFLHPDLPSMAGAYLFHLCPNHSFGDGNKRVAVSAAETFIRVNNRFLLASNDELRLLVLGVAQHRIFKDEVISFFRKHIRKSK